MLREERRALILKYITQKKVASSEELSEQFAVTSETIRQDLSYLSNKNLIIRTFGGAMMKEDNDSSLEQRTVINLEEKQKIANRALEYIEHGDLIVMDAGSTLVEVAKRIEDNTEVVIVTNSLEILNQLSQKNGITVIGTGGKLRSKSKSFQGRNAINAIGSYNLQKAFISAEAVGLDVGIMDTNEAEASVKRSMIEAAKSVTVLADHSKFKKMAHITVCPLDKIDRVITDEKTEQGIIEELQRHGIEVIVAK